MAATKISIVEGELLLQIGFSLSADCMFWWWNIKHIPVTFFTCPYLVDFCCRGSLLKKMLTVTVGLSTAGSNFSTIIVRKYMPMLVVNCCFQNILAALVWKMLPALMWKMWDATCLHACIILVDGQMMSILGSSLREIVESNQWQLLIISPPYVIWHPNWL